VRSPNERRGSAPFNDQTAPAGGSVCTAVNESSLKGRAIQASRYLHPVCRDIRDKLERGQGHLPRRIQGCCAVRGDLKRSRRRRSPPTPIAMIDSTYPTMDARTIPQRHPSGSAAPEASPVTTAIA
jgi:hypothetical protein